MTRHWAALAALGLGLLVLPACSRRAGRVDRVVIVTFDTTRADHLGCYGRPGNATENLDRFAADAVVFDQAVSAIPTTLPSHSTMFTGLYPQDHGVRYNLNYALGRQAVTLAELLQQAGFATAAFPASFIVGRQYGLDQGFDTWVEPPSPEGAMRFRGPEAVMRPAQEGVDLALDWLGEHPGRVFAWLHFYDPHGPYTPPFPYSSTYRDDPYLGELAYADAQFGRLLRALEQDPAWERTMVLVAGDHGEGLHDHRERFHSYLLYESTQHVPFIVRTPGTSPHRVAEPVTLADVMPTVLDLTGVAVPEAIRGVSLRPALEGRDLQQRDLYFESKAGQLNFGWADLYGVRFGKWKLIDSPDPELYDLEADPGELQNLAGMQPELLQELRQALDELKHPLTETAAVDAVDAVPDPQTEALLASLGYLAGGSGESSSSAVHPRDVIDLTEDMNAGRRAIAGEDWKGLEDACRYLLSRDPTHKWGLSNLAGALISQGRAKEAQQPAARMVEEYPKEAASYATLAGTYQVLGDFRTAHQILRQGLESVTPGSERLSYLSLLAGFDAAIPSACGEELEQALEDFPRSTRVLVMESRCQARAGDADGALATLEQAGELGFREFAVFDEADEYRRIREGTRFKELVERFGAEAEKQESSGGYGSTEP